MQGVMRDKKRNNRGVISALEKEANRDREMHEKGKDFENSNIDWDLTDQNIHLIRSDNWNKALDDLYKKYGVKPRKDSVLGFDTVYSASPEYFDIKPGETPEAHKERIEKYFEDCLDHHIRTKCQGDRDRIINAVIHLDEKTPHLQIFTASIWKDPGKDKYSLNAKKIFGNKKDMSERQQSLYDDVLEPRGFDERKIKTELEADHKSQAQYRKEQKAREEQEIQLLKEQKQELELSILDKEKRELQLVASLEEKQDRNDQLKQENQELKAKGDTGIERYQELLRLVEDLEQKAKAKRQEYDKDIKDLEELQERLGDLRQEYEILDNNIEHISQMNDAIEKLAKDSRNIFPREFDTHPSQRDFRGNIKKPKTIEVEYEAYQKLVNQRPYQPRDTWDLSRIERELHTIQRALEGSDNQKLKEELTQSQQRERSQEIEMRKIRTELENIKYDLQQWIEREQNPTISNELQKILEQTPTQEQTPIQGQSHHRGRS